MPAALDAWCQLLERFGTRSLADVLAPARGLAERGFPMYAFLRNILSSLEPRFSKHWLNSAAIYLPLRGIGRRQTNPALADFFGAMMAAERGASGADGSVGRPPSCLAGAVGRLRAPLDACAGPPPRAAEQA